MCGAMASIELVPNVYATRSQAPLGNAGTEAPLRRDAWLPGSAWERGAGQAAPAPNSLTPNAAKSRQSLDGSAFAGRALKRE